MSTSGPLIDCGYARCVSMHRDCISTRRARHQRSEQAMPRILILLASVFFQSHPSVITLHNGANAIDLLGNGSRGQAIVAYRANYNAHGHTDVAFSIFATSDLDAERLWQVVP